MYNFKDFLNFSNNLQYNRGRLIESARPQPLEQPIVNDIEGEPGDQPDGGNTPRRSPRKPPPDPDWSTPTPPTHPGEKPVRREGESSFDWENRISGWRSRLNAYQKYMEVCPTGSCPRLWSFPHPPGPIQYQGWKPGDWFVSFEGKLYLRTDTSPFWVEKKSMS
jgi:hypothetical protein